MNQAAALLVGDHDFSSFQGADWIERNPHRTMLRSTLREDGDFLIYDVQARSFLRHMVRNIVGTLVDVGRGAISVERFAEIFAAWWSGSNGSVVEAFDEMMKEQFPLH